ncbi:HA1F protein, partial [Dasyornis broadbenti]|nr:HA1F protein [Dasyornis broadbenti]
VLHSLRYQRVTVSEPSPELPPFMAVAFVDEIPFMRYDSERGQVEPRMLWMKDRAEPGYWDTETRVNRKYQQKDLSDLKSLQVLYNQSGGLHTMQRECSCDLLSDESVRGSFRQGCNGQDFLSFDLGSGSFVAADSTAQIIKRLWESNGITVEFKNDLEHTCVEVLKKHVRDRQEVLERKEVPNVRVSGKDEHGILTLSCCAYGFYPCKTGINWMKGDEIWDQETEQGGIVPNSDGTFHTWARIEVRQEQYRCQVEHPRMPEPGIFAWEPESNGNLTLVIRASIIAVIVILLIGFGIWKCQSGNTQGGGW